MRRLHTTLAALAIWLLPAGPAAAACREVLVTDGASGQIRKQTVCDDDPRERRDLERRVRDLERRERWRSDRESRERWESSPGVIVVPPPDRRD